MVTVMKLSENLLMILAVIFYVVEMILMKS
ncbi:hypothetical protein N035_014305 [Klebsiella pneumoniae EGD-HP19-C]|nr:hypothetical protein N035_014305 [Klebsiella pneumoniae EGD-HP19-C]